MNTYALGSDEQEQQRLERQASILSEITERFLREAGLRPGMRVLDLGCGVGDVAMLAARIVGPLGEVVAVDRDPAMLETTRRRADGPALPVRVVEADVMRLDLDEEPFDAVIGRLLLMHLPDAPTAVRAATRHVREGGIVAFQEFTSAEVRVYPPLPKTQTAVDRITDAFERLGCDVRCGDNLRAIFLAAGLPEPELRAESLIGGGPDASVFWMIRGVTETLLTAMEGLGLAAPGEIDPERLYEEVRDEVGEARGVVVAPLVGAWARVSP